MSSESRSTADAAGSRLRDLEAVFQALAHPTRRQILLVLHFRDGEMTAGEIAERFACRWPTTTRHLGKLCEAGLIRVRRRGRERVYRLDRRRLLSVAGGWLRWFSGPAATKESGSTERD